MRPVLLPPEVTQQGGHPAPRHLETMDLRMAGRAKSNQGGGVVPTRPTMVNDKARGGGTSAAAVAVAVEDGSSMAPKVSRRVSVPPVAGPAQAGYEGGFATRTEQPGLQGAAVGHGSLYLITEIIGSDKFAVMSHL